MDKINPIQKTVIVTIPMETVILNHHFDRGVFDNPSHKREASHADLNPNNEARNSYAIRAPNELKEGMDSDWLDITISLVVNRVLRRIINLDACRNEPIKGFDSFKRQLCDKFTNTVKFKFYSIVDYGEKVTQLVKQILPKTETSDDIDRLIQDRFVEGLYNQRLREKIRAKMLKMRQIETEKVYKIQDLIDYLLFWKASLSLV
ncbi:hypothetical protein BpHYR1_019953, partial [Brachionus plicatilis]